MKRIIFCLAALLGFTAAYAGTATVTWTNPAQYTDGTALAAADITQTRVEYGSCSGTTFGTKAGQQIVAGSATSAAITLAAGTYCFRAYTTAKGAESVASNVTSATVAQPAPNPPVLVTVSTTAYTIGRQGRYFAMVPAGTVPLGTACRQAVKLAGLYQLPREAVTTTSKALWFFGRCASACRL
ncbi:MAG: hypothetical protein U1F35_05485 [Steroidobacteraceae bacterium]